MGKGAGHKLELVIVTAICVAVITGAVLYQSNSTAARPAKSSAAQPVDRSLTNQTTTTPSPSPSKPVLPTPFRLGNLATISSAIPHALGVRVAADPAPPISASAVVQDFLVRANAVHPFTQSPTSGGPLACSVYQGLVTSFLPTQPGGGTLAEPATRPMAIVDCNVPWTVQWGETPAGQLIEKTWSHLSWLLDEQTGKIMEGAGHN